MTPQAFIAKWRDNPLSERAGAQPHFEDLCDLLGVVKPRDSESYQYERGAARTGAGRRLYTARYLPSPARGRGAGGEGVGPHHRTLPHPKSSPASGRGTSIARRREKAQRTEEQANFPLRPVAKPGHEAKLKKRKLTNLYKASPAWLDNAHKELDAAVATAYGWADYTPEMRDEEILRRLLALNLERAARRVQ
ncbi:MAG: hypothetical protein WCA45_09245 [Thiobacillaceae bacterium]